MLKVVLAAVATIAVVFLGGRLLVRAETVARSSDAKIRSVATVLEKAAADSRKAERDRGPSAAETRWVRDVNALCRRETREIRALPRPRSLAEIETYLEKALAIGRRYEAEFEALRPPRRYAREVTRLERLSAAVEAGLQRMLAGARRRDPASVLDEATALVSLARRANPGLIRLGLVDCALPASGIPV
jgi:hypothetical protein